MAAAQHRIVTSWVKPGLVPVERLDPHYAIEGTIVIDSDLGSPSRYGRWVAVCSSVPIVRAASVMPASSSASASPIVRVSPPRFSAAST